MRRYPLLPLLPAGLVVLVGAVLLCRPKRPLPTPTPPTVWATDVESLPREELHLGEKAKGPLEGQKRPPCAPRVEREVAGACWQPHLERPPCPEGLYEGQGMCLVPVRAAKRPDTSIRR